MMTYYEETLIKAYEYGGFRFWENYILSNIIRNLAEDIRVLGNKSVIDGYVCLYGEQVEDLMEFLVTQDIELLRECSKITNGLLFEDYLETSMRKYLIEKLIVGLDKTPNFGTAAMGAGEAAYRGTLARQAGMSTMLRNVWEKLKSVGRAIFAPLVPFLKQGFAWAKGLAKQGLAWFNATPWAKILLPVLLITGSVAVARRLLNRVRRKKLTKQESAAMEQYATKNNLKINELRRKAGLKPITV